MNENSEVLVIYDCLKNKIVVHITLGLRCCSDCIKLVCFSLPVFLNKKYEKILRSQAIFF